MSLKPESDFNGFKSMSSLSGFLVTTRWSLCWYHFLLDLVGRPSLRRSEMTISSNIPGFSFISCNVSNILVILILLWFGLSWSLTKKEVLNSSSLNFCFSDVVSSAFYFLNSSSSFSSLAFPSCASWKLAPPRSRPRRLAFWRFGVILGFSFLHLFQAATPWLRISRCSSFGVLVSLPS